MQFLEEFANTLQDSGSLQFLRENFQDLTRRVLSHFEGPQDTLYGKVSGDFNYHFTFKLEGGGYFQTGVLVASAESPNGLPVPLRCTWKRRVDDLPVEIQQVTSNMYQISADDVGTEIIVEARPADNEEGVFGVAIGQIGPFELDPATRRSLDNALGFGSHRFSVTQLRDGATTSASASAAAGSRELSINVSQECVRVANTQGSGGREVVAEYSPDYPRVIIHTLDIQRFQLEMNEGRRFNLVAPSRSARDLIALTIRCFHAKKHISTASILRRVLPVLPASAGLGLTPPGVAPTPPDPRLDQCIVLERLLKELNRAIQHKESSDRVLRNTNIEKRQLQDQLTDSISGFTEVLQNLQEQFPSDPAAVSLAAGDVQSSLPFAATDERLQEQVRENDTLKAEIERCRTTTARLQSARQASALAMEQAAEAMAEEARTLRKERDVLQARLDELSQASDPAQKQHQLEQVHAKEVKRLRQDLEALHSRKERLRNQLQEKDREREELQHNFLYVKGQLDKVQLRQVQAASVASGGDQSRELRKHRESVDMLAEDRTRLANRLEAVLNEADKEKAYHEQSVDRIMQANAKLMEEKDRAAREVKRLSQLYADSVKQFQQDDSLMMTAASGVYRSERAYDAGGDVDQEEVRKVRLELASIDEALRKRDQENESLKSRIRKLAVA